MTPDAQLIAALRNGDEAAFMELVERYQMALLRVAAIYAGSYAEDVVQETWMGVLKGIHQFEGRSSFKTWLFTILTNRAKTRAHKEDRYVELPEDDPAVPEERFRPAGEELAGHWTSASRPEDFPEEHLLEQETLTIIKQAIANLPVAQREVITLRDIEHLSAEEVCMILGITDANQRVLLHRARSKVRLLVEDYFRNL